MHTSEYTTCMYTTLYVHYTICTNILAQPVYTTGTTSIIGVGADRLERF